MEQGDQTAEAGGGFRLKPLGTAWIVLSLACLLPYLNALRAGFVYDDQVLIVQQLSKLGAFHPIAALVRPYWTVFPDGNLWRPVTTFSLEMDWRVSGGSPAWFHLVSLLIHLGTTLLLYRLLQQVRAPRAPALAAGLLFAVHPVHTEAVTWASGRAELLAAFFTLGAINLAVASRPRVALLAVAACFLAVGSKESGAMAPLLILFTGWMLGRTRDRLSPSCYRTGLLGVAAVLLYAVLRRLVLGTWSGPIPNQFDNPVVGLGSGARLPTVLDAAGRYLMLLLWPSRLSIDYSGSVIGVVRSLTPGIVTGLAGIGGLVALVLLGKSAAGKTRQATEGLPAEGLDIRRLAGWGAGFAILAFLPASNLIVVIGTILGERLVYLPSAGIFVAAASVVVWLHRSRIRRARPALPREAGTTPASSRVALRGAPMLLVLILLGLSARTWIRNRDYRDELTFFGRAAAAVPGSARMHYSYALQLNHAGRYEESVAEARACLNLDPGDRQARDVLGSSLELAGRPREAIGFLLGAIRLDPMDRMARQRLCGLLERQGLAAQEESLLIASAKDDPGEVDWMVRLAKLEQGRGDYAGAAKHWRKALNLAPWAEDIPAYLAFCLIQTGDLAGARRAYEQMLRRYPKDPDAANGLAWTLLETGGSPEDAVRLARQAVSQQPTAPRLDTLARACLAAGDCAGALEAATRAAQLDPDDKELRQRLEAIREKCRGAS